jgi:hypothetical protein
MKLTKTLAIIISRDMWLWLSECTGRKKHEYPLFYDLGIDIMEAHCPCCHLAVINYISCDKGCPIRDCNFVNSAWDVWAMSGDKDAAHEIFSRLDSALNRM